MMTCMYLIINEITIS